MNTFFELQLKAGAIIGVSILVYVFLLARDSFFQRNRAWLLATLIVPWIMPLLAMPMWLKNWLFAMDKGNTAILLPIDQQLPANLPQEVAQQGFDWQMAIMLVFGVVSSVLLLRLLWGYRIIFMLQKKAKKHSYKGHKVVLMDDDTVNPFSFFRTIFVPKSLERQAEGTMILEHERTHCSQLHSIDISLAEWLLVIQWWNPFVWWLRKLIAQNHEYCVDNAMIQQTTEAKYYQYSLLNLLQGSKRLQLVNNFNQNLTKKRIVMMNKKHTNKIIGWSKGVLIVPLMLALLVGFTNPEKAYETAPSDDITSANDLRRFVAKTIKYPLKAHELGAEAEVLVQFDVTGSGKVRNVKIGQSNDDAIQLSEVIVVAYGNPVAVKSFSGNNKLDVDGFFESEVKSLINKMPLVTDEALVGKTLALKVKFMLQAEPEPMGKESTSHHEDPIFILDGKSITKAEADGIAPESIKRVNVIKGQTATDKYGERAKDGAVELFTTIGDASQAHQRVVVGRPLTKDVVEREMVGKNPLIIVGEKEYDGNLESISEEQVKEIGILNEEQGLKRYGTKGEEGVVIIKTQEEDEKDAVKVIGYGSMRKDEPFEAGSMVVESYGESAVRVNIKGEAWDKQPLYIIDGEEYNGKMEDVDSNDIESITVLKDKSATELYGDKAENGVIIIVMKPKVK